MAGIVYYANYLRYIERARSDYVRDLGIDQRQMRDAGQVFAVRRVEADYLTPAHFDDQLEVRTEVQSASAARLVLVQTVWRDKTRIFHAIVTIVCLEQGGRPARLPAKLRLIAPGEAD